MKFAKNILYIFLFAFVFNFIWEQAHSCFYIHYKGEEITNLILLRAALFDATFIAILGALFFGIKYLRNKLWLAFVVGVIFAIGLELFALQTGRWEYNSMMPIIPFINTGLTPTIQLGLLAYITFKIVGKKNETKKG